jgi:ATP-dependent Lon protease
MAPQNPSTGPVDDTACCDDVSEDLARCIGGLAAPCSDDEPKRLAVAGSITSEQRQQPPGIDIYDREEALRQIDLLAGSDSPTSRRLSEVDDSRLACLREVVDHKPRRPLLYPSHGWRLNLASLREDCPPFGSVTALIDRAVSLSITTETPLRLPPILLVGPPGVGKTHYCRALAETLSTSAHRIACNTNSDAKQLFVGLSTAWRAARMGVITEAMLLSETASPLVILDEVDKFRTHVSEDPYSVLLSVLEAENSRAIEDEYLRVPFDLSRAFFVATANDLDALPGFIIDRLLVFSIGQPGRDQLFTIARRIVVAEIDQHGGFFTPPDEAVIARLARWHPRRITRLLPLALGFAATAERNHLSIADIDAAEQIAASGEQKRPIGFMPMHAAQR